MKKELLFLLLVLCLLPQQTAAKKIFAAEEHITAPKNIIARWQSAPNNRYAGTAEGLYRYNGKTWSHISLPAPIPVIFSLWGSSPKNIYAVGLGGRFHFNGRKWKRLSSRVGTGVWGTSRSNIFIVNRGIMHFNGTTWQPMLVPNTAGQLKGIWGLSRKDVYAVGADSTVLHYNGNRAMRWEPLTEGLAEAHHELYAIWGTAPDHLIAVGFNTVLQYNGRRWSSVGSGLPYQDWFHAVWGHSSSSFYARTFEHGETLFFRNNSPQKGPAGIILAEHPFAKEDITHN